MKTIVLIGAGQLGSRHLQGLAKVDFDVSIEVVDSSEKSLAVAKDRYEQIPKNEKVKQIKYLNSISSASDNIDLSIIATTANVRLGVLKELMKKNISNIILEKVAFQKEDDFIEAFKIIKTTKVWVNCPKRAYPFFQEIKEMLGGEEFSYTVKSGNNALASNALHYLDDFSFLCGSYDFKLDAFFDDEIIKSRHNGCIELSGLIYAKSNKSRLNINFSQFDSTSIISILSENFLFVINEFTGEAYVGKKSNNWELEKSDKKAILFQSDVSNILAADILFKGKSDLIKLEDSYKLHKPLFDLINRHLKNSGLHYDFCPIS